MNSYLIHTENGKMIVVRANSLNEAMLLSQEDFIPVDWEDFSPSERLYN
ncbi:hypothetical protein HMPREF1987_02107 [Peptostreptococcaceae bacterium oral taxon 113 str. W5053]|nr:hypothetical protein HMPREF1987_02107 [Peptostreptococcaceae bacterium oral taxon 113 str. W5053]